MSLAKTIAGTWVADADMDPMTNVYGRKWWAPCIAMGDNIEGTYRGFWPKNEKPQGLHWLFENTPTKEGE